MSRIDDGLGASISFGGASSGVTLLVYEKEITPPGVSGGGANETSTLRNSTWRTNSPKGLISLSEASFQCAYDPECYDEIIAMLNDNQEVVITFPDDSTLTFWAWIDSFTPGPMTEGAQATADVTIIPSNQNAAGTETAPVYSA